MIITYSNIRGTNNKRDKRVQDLFVQIELRHLVNSLQTTYKRSNSRITSSVFIVFWSTNLSRKFQVWQSPRIVSFENKTVLRQNSFSFNSSFTGVIRLKSIKNWAFGLRLPCLREKSWGFSQKITHKKCEVTWLRALSFAVCRSYPI